MPNWCGCCGRSRQTLRALHGHEVLAGLLLDDDDDATDRGLGGPARPRRRPPIVQPTTTSSSPRHPVLLSLVPPRIGGAVSLPPPPASPPVAPAAAGGEAAVREALRLRVRWVQELTARAALVLGGRLVGRGVLTSADAVTSLRLDELAALGESGGLAVPRPPRGRRAGTAAAGRRSGSPTTASSSPWHPPAATPGVAPAVDAARDRSTSAPTSRAGPG